MVERIVPKLDREVEYIQHAHVFTNRTGLRCGSTMVLGYAHTPVAILVYESMLASKKHPETGEDLGYKHLLDGFGKVQVIVCDKPLPRGEEVLPRHARGQAYFIGKLEYRTRTERHPEWSEWFDDVATLVMWLPDTWEYSEDFVDGFPGYTPTPDVFVDGDITTDFRLISITGDLGDHYGLGINVVDADY